MTDYKNELIFYLCAALLAVYSQMAIEIFHIYSIPVFLFVVLLFVIKHKSVDSVYFAVALIIWIASIYFISPANYLFTYLIIHALVIFALCRVFKNLLPQLILNGLFLAILLIKPGYILVMFMHYQRLMLSIADIII